MPTENQYAQRDIVQLDEDGDHCIRHVSAMTAEGLHAKSDIAAELAWRDREIARLREVLERIANGPYIETREIARAALESGDDGAD